MIRGKTRLGQRQEVVDGGWWIQSTAQLVSIYETSVRLGRKVDMIEVTIEKHYTKSGLNT